MAEILKVFVKRPGDGANDCRGEGKGKLLNCLLTSGENFSGVFFCVIQVSEHYAFILQNRGS